MAGGKKDKLSKDELAIHHTLQYFMDKIRNTLSIWLFQPICCYSLKNSQIILPRVLGNLKRQELEAKHFVLDDGTDGFLSKFSRFKGEQPR